MLHPAVLLAVAVLALNDHLLKGRYGNALTGKLSDVAGVFVFPLLILAVAEGLLFVARSPSWRSGEGRVVLAVAITAVGFAAVKTVPVVGDAYEVVIATMRGLRGRSVVTRDPSDLWVLPVLTLSYLLARRRLVETPRHRAERRSPAG